MLFPFYISLDRFGKFRFNSVAHIYSTIRRAIHLRV